MAGDALRCHSMTLFALESAEKCAKWRQSELHLLQVCGSNELGLSACLYFLRCDPRSRFSKHQPFCCYVDDCEVGVDPSNATYSCQRVGTFLNNLGPTSMIDVLHHYN